MERFPSDLDFRSRKHIFETFRTLHRKLKEDYFLETKEKEHQPVESSQWDCMILSPNGIFAVESFRGVYEYKRFWADGSGYRFALGAMNSIYDLYDTAEKIALAGIQSVCDFDENSGLPAQIFSMDLKKN